MVLLGVNDIAFVRVRCEHSLIDCLFERRQSAAVRFTL